MPLTQQMSASQLIKISVGGFILVAMLISSFWPNDTSSSTINLVTAVLAQDVLTPEELIQDILAPEELSLDLPSGGELAGGALLESILTPVTDDLKSMQERQVIRVLTSFSPTNYYFENGVATGIVADAAQQFEKFINRKFKDRHINVVVMAAPIEQLFVWLEQGHGDIVAGNITITDERAEEFSFSAPFITDIDEQIILGPSVTQDIQNLNELADANIELIIRANSSFAEHLKTINMSRQAAGRSLIRYRFSDNSLHEEDLLELVSGGLIDATVMDSYLLQLWVKVFTNLKTPLGLTTNQNGKIAWAVRKENPQLLQVIDEFTPKMRKGTLLGNIVIKRYLKNRTRVKKALTDLSTQRLGKIIENLKHHAETYEFDWLLLAALGFQESRLDQRARSHQGAVGIMQVLPSTAREPYINIDSIHTLEGNIEASAKYHRWLIDTYFSGPDISPDNQILFSLASYNAGPGNLLKARKHAKKMHLNPNVWFNNVELAMAKYISKEPITYVRNIYKYYTAYRLYYSALETKQKNAPKP
jgi:membrane-bound lytic murein transglycosylase MltF